MFPVLLENDIPFHIHETREYWNDVGSLTELQQGTFDALDGRVARRLGVASRFGAELDSLSDFLCFGVTPALVLYLASLKDGGRSPGWCL